MAWNKRSKFRAIKVKDDEGTYDSKKEHARWQQLKLLQQSGIISNLTRDKKDCTFEIVINGMKVCKYIADAIYIESGTKVVEDTKSHMTRKNPVYRLKNKLVKAVFGIEIREV